MYLTELNRLLNPVYSVGIDLCSMREVPMLDISIFKDCKDGVWSLSWKPYCKPTARHVPLHESSAHPVSIHSAWPVNEIQRAYKNSCRWSDFLSEKQRLISRFQKFFLHPRVIAACSAWTPRLASPWQNVVSVLPPDQLRISRLILPYHPLLRGLRCIIRDVTHIHQNAQHRKFGPIELSFSKGGQNALTQLASCSLRNHLWRSEWRR